MTNGTGPNPRVVILNGQRVTLPDLPTQTTLLDFLRDRGLTGAKEGCAEGECGACTVAMVVPCGTGSAYRAVNSCLMFLPMAAGKEILTVEGLAQGNELAPAQAAMVDAGGSQCGYCTPGFVMSLFAEHYRPDRQGPCDPHAMSGNLCRCTGYRPIQHAARSLGKPPAGALLDRLARPTPALGAFEYQCGGARFHRPESLAECFSIVARDADACWIHGATDLGVESNLRYRRWPHLVSLEAIPELQRFEESDTAIRIGAGLPLSEIERRWRRPPRAVDQWFPLFASQTIRNRATLGGNLATASPIGDSAPLLLALDASLHLASAGGTRTVPLSGFFAGYRQTLLRPGELILEVEIPKPLPAFTRFYKASKRRTDDISTVAAGFAIEFDSAGRVERARFAFGGVGPVPLRALEAEEVAVGQPWNEATIGRIQSALQRFLKPISDHRGSAEYRLELAKSLVEKFWWEWRSAAA